ncbi:hypothetical protein [Leptospira montravelensis]|uniref:hypothetical protein n=1 Tax=Leptospira montravelensis TaxID=2484961 RepID=UPI0010828B1C|nr:hypothetical protein [Leptospira montravelensis]
MTEKQACFHDLKRDGESDNMQCLLLPLYYDSAINDQGKTEKERESLISLKNSTIKSCAETSLKSEKCRNKSNYKITVRS